MTPIEHDLNYMYNTSSMLGFTKGYTKAWLEQLQDILKTGRGVETRDIEFLIGRMENAMAIVDKWWELRYWDNYTSEQIIEILEKEKADKSDTVELERA
jgi:hypothetical protein